MLAPSPVPSPPVLMNQTDYSAYVKDTTATPLRSQGLLSCPPNLDQLRGSQKERRGLPVLGRGRGVDSKPQTEIVTGVEGRKRKKGGRVSNLIKTLEQGQLQGNKINKYFSTNIKMERGHPLSFSRICENVQKREFDCDGLPGVNMGSARKKPRVQ